MKWCEVVGCAVCAVRWLLGCLLGHEGARASDVAGHSKIFNEAYRIDHEGLQRAFGDLTVDRNLGPRRDGNPCL